ncbi:MAG: ATP-binding protein [Verrucomicrobiota bacterium]
MAGIAHEVKNPLAIIKMGLEFIGQLDSVDESFEGVLEEMQHAVHRADGVILGLLDFSRTNQLETTSEDLNLLLENALSLVRGEVKGAIEFVRHLAPDLPHLPLDREKISQVLINLLTNAIHAMAGGGVLTVSTSSRQLTGVGCNIAGEKSEAFRIGQTIAVLEIEDSGHGIPEEKLGKIFEPFFTTKPTGKGTGLGLSVVKTIIDLHQGTIDIQNLPGRGVRATLMFPVKKLTFQQT